MTDSHFTRGAEKIRRRIQAIQAGTAVALNPDNLENLLVRRIKQRFDRAVDADGRAWPPLAERTVLLKKNAAHQDPLKRTGLMYDSIRRIRKGSADKFAVSTGAGFRIGVDNEVASVYARLMNNGFFHVRAKRWIPARRFLGIGELDRKAVDNHLRRYIIRQGLGD